MSDFLILPGRNLNILDGCKSLVSSDPEAGYDAENVANGVPSHPFKFDDPGTDDYLLADLDRLIYGDMETWVVTTCPVGWEKTGTVAKEAGTKHAGAFSAKLSADAQLFKTILVPAGWAMTVDSWLYSDGAKKIDAYIWNPLTGNYLASDGSWGATDVYGTQTAAAWAQKTVEFIVEGYATCGYSHLVPLEIWFEHENGGGGAFVDDVFLWPHWNIASIHGHNFPPKIAVKFQSDDNLAMASPTTQATATVIHPAFYDKIATIVKERFARLFLEGGVTYEKAMIGEWVLGQYQTLGKGHDHGPVHTNIMPITRASEYSRIPRSDRSHRRLQLDFTSLDTAYETMREMLDRARGGADPMLIVPFDTEDVCMFGHFPTEQNATRLFLEHYSYGLEFQELAFPFNF